MKAIRINLKGISDKKLKEMNTKLGLIDGCLIDLKEDSSAIFIHSVNKGVIGGLAHKGVIYDEPVYKGLILANEYTYLSKKEKDSLLKLKPFDFSTLDKVSTDVANVKLNTKVSKLEVILDTDSILDKISKYGIASLVTEERVFLDNLSKN